MITYVFLFLCPKGLYDRRTKEQNEELVFFCSYVQKFYRIEEAREVK